MHSCMKLKMKQLKCYGQKLLDSTLTAQALNSWQIFLHLWTTAEVNQIPYTYLNRTLSQEYNVCSNSAQCSFRAVHALVHFIT